MAQLMEHVKTQNTTISSVHYFGLLALLLAFSVPAIAQNNFNLELLNPGEIMVNLNANEEAQVEQDTLHVNLYYAAQGRDRVSLQDEVNRKMAAAREVLEESDIEYSIQQYRVYEVQPGRPTRGDVDNAIWRAQQSMTLNGQDMDAILDLVAELQGLELVMGGMNYSLSRAREEEVADSLMANALAKLNSRAEAAAMALGKSGSEIVEISMNSGSNAFYRTGSMAMEMAARDVATPVAEPGMATVNFNVSARVILLP